MMRRLLLSLLLLPACSESGSSSPDASGPDAAYDTARCLIKGHYGAVGSITGGPMGANGVSATLDAGPPRDAFFVKLTAGKGVFTGGLANGTYTISGVDANYNNCGLCVHIIADIVAGSGPSKFYFADAGSVTLTGTGPVAGSAQNLHLAEVDIGTGMKIPGGCEATIDSIMFATQ
jgi:hypothetical protein